LECHLSSFYNLFGTAGRVNSAIVKLITNAEAYVYIWRWDLDCGFGCRDVNLLRGGLDDQESACETLTCQKNKKTKRVSVLLPGETLAAIDTDKKNVGQNQWGCCFLLILSSQIQSRIF